MSCPFLPLEALDKPGETLALSIAIGVVDLVGIPGEHALGSIAHPGDDRPDFVWVRFWDSSTIKDGRAMKRLPMSLITLRSSRSLPMRSALLQRHRWIEQKSKVGRRSIVAGQTIERLASIHQVGLHPQLATPLVQISGKPSHDVLSRTSALLIRLAHPSCLSLLKRLG
jgi:hypothetical protein